MARLRCKCGYTLSNSTEPEIQYDVFSNDKMLELLDALEEGRKFIDIYSSYRIETWKCPSCNRIYVFKEGEDKPVKIYREELGDGSVSS